MMVVQLVPRTYAPVLTLNKIYDKTLYYDTAKNADAEDAMYGITLNTTVGGTAVDGYLTTKQIMTASTLPMLQPQQNRFCMLTPAS